MNRARIKDFLLDIFFPNRCPLCGKVIKWDIPYCEKCFDELPQTGSELCRGCGNEKIYCSCGRESFSFVRCYAAFYYEGRAKSAVIYLKNTMNTAFPRITAEKLYDDIRSDSYKFKADYIIPVPMTKSKYRAKGYNHAELIAEALSELLDVPVRNDAIVKRYSLTAQHNKSAAGRKISVRGLYVPGKSEDIAGKIIILCDDVITTGSTMNKCAQILTEMGAAAVIAAAAAATK